MKMKLLTYSVKEKCEIRQKKKKLPQVFGKSSNRVILPIFFSGTETVLVVGLFCRPLDTHTHSGVGH